MKVAVNVTYGAFRLPVEFSIKYDIKDLYSDEYDRYSPELIEFIEQNPDKRGPLRVLTIPEAATDYTIEEYDGAEDIIYVLDGKLHWAGEEYYNEHEDEEDDDVDWSDECWDE